MKGPRELKLYVSRFRNELKSIHFDDLLIFKLERCKKWKNRAKDKSNLHKQLKGEYDG